MDYNMQNVLAEMKRLFAGKWTGEGFAKFPTIDDTAYTEQLEFVSDEYKDAIFFNQKTWYKNDTEKNGHTVFWDAVNVGGNNYRLINEHNGQCLSIWRGDTNDNAQVGIYACVDTPAEIFTLVPATSPVFAGAYQFVNVDGIGCGPRPALSVSETRGSEVGESDRLDHDHSPEPR